VNDRHVVRAAVRPRQFGRQRIVLLDDDQPLSALVKVTRQLAGAAANLDDGVTGLDSGGVSDAREDTAVDEPVLAEGLLAARAACWCHTAMIRQPRGRFSGAVRPPQSRRQISTCLAPQSYTSLAPYARSMWAPMTPPPVSVATP